MKPKPQTWTKTRHSQLYRHSSGGFYARLQVGGKKTWRSLKTDVLSIAKAELDKLLKGEAASAEIRGKEAVNLKLTLGEAKALRLEEIANDVSLKPATRHYWNQIAVSVSRSWAGFDDLEARKVTPTMCQEWAARQIKGGLSGTRYNNSLSFLRQLFEMAIKQGARLSNPANEVKRVRVKSKDLASGLPTKELFGKFVTAIRTAGGRFSKDAGDFVEGLAYSGVRKNEAANIKLYDIDDEREEIVVRGDAEDGTKNGLIRRIPINPAMKRLIDQIKARRGAEALDSPLFRVCSSGE